MRTVNNTLTQIIKVQITFERRPYFWALNLKCTVYLLSKERGLFQIFPYDIVYYISHIFIFIRQYEILDVNLCQIYSFLRLHCTPLPHPRESYQVHFFNKHVVNDIPWWRLPSFLMFCNLYDSSWLPLTLYLELKNKIIDRFTRLLQW